MGPRCPTCSVPGGTALAARPPVRGRSPRRSGALSPIPASRRASGALPGRTRWLPSPPSRRRPAVVVTWGGGATTDRRVAPGPAQDRPGDAAIVGDNASSEPERARRGAAPGGRRGVRPLPLDENRQFAGGLNAGAEAAIAAGAERLLLLNNDTVLAPDALGRLAAALDVRPRVGIAGPRLMDLREPARELSAGERHILPLLCLPRTWLRYRPRTPAPYPVTGVMGAALLVTRACYQAVGGSAALHALRGRGDVVRALARGALAGIGAAAGRGVTPVGPPGGS